MRFSRASIACILGTLLAATSGCSSAEDGVRVQAASDIGCPQHEVAVERLGEATYLATGCGVALHCESRPYLATSGRYRWRVRQACSPIRSEARTSAPPPAAPKAKLLPDPPTGAAGFLLGASEDDVRRACEQAHNEYTPADGESRASCSGLAAQLGAPGRAHLVYCGAGPERTLCELDVQIAVAPAESLTQSLTQWRDTLVERYGRPSEHADMPDACLDHVTPCLLDGTGRVSFDWQWRSREQITLFPQVDDARRASIVVRYSVPPTAGSLAPAR